ncbi:hypothetical protein [Paenibacillus sp. Leaf72]|uniref:hypothetical protein n=1 Tax=Paenibacillus sp. Leaf72 TaxID=1736234 RepID=UPI0006FE3EB3|nr:hypothetical protein [Paenibacillus sp. Leaf72]KQN97584.1 hypothetical protein ASF12_20440 [Paenibacillus sp. Leaf72]
MKKTEEQLYAEVSRITSVLNPYDGTYFRLCGEALFNGEMSLEQFADKMRVADAVFADVIKQLRGLRFPKMKQRSALSKLLSGLQAYRNGLAAAASTNWELADVHFDRALASSREYTGFAFRDRMKGAI